MVKRKDNSTRNTIIIAVAIIIFALIIAPKLDINFLTTSLTDGKQIVSSQQLDQIVNNPPMSRECTLDITPNIICKNDFITGTLIDGQNSNCYIFANDGSGWQLVLTGRTDQYSEWKDTQRFGLLGNFQFLGFCDRDNSGSFTDADCFTNVEYLTVRDCIPDSPPSDPTTYTCGQGADQTTCGGTCPVNYACYELWGDNYKWCACATGSPMEGGTGEVHPDWKPNGQYFNPVEYGEEYNGEGSQQTCTDSDGGKDYFTKGQVTGYMEGGYFIDGSWDACTSSSRLSEYYCYEKDGIMYANWETYNCENLGMGWGCYQGICMEII